MAKAAPDRGQWLRIGITLMKRDPPEEFTTQYPAFITWDCERVGRSWSLTMYHQKDEADFSVGLPQKWAEIYLTPQDIDLETISDFLMQFIRSDESDVSNIEVVKA